MDNSDFFAGYTPGLSPRPDDAVGFPSFAALNDALDSSDAIREHDEDLTRPPMTLGELKHIVQHYNDRNDAPITARYCETNESLSASLLDFMQEAGESSSPSENRQMWALKVEGSPHLSLILGEYHDGQIYFLSTDSAGVNGPYARGIVRTLTQYGAHNPTVLVLGPCRQFSKQNCGLFVFNDMKFFARNPNALQDVLEFGNLETPDGAPYTSVTLPPPDLMRYFESSRRVIEFFEAYDEMPVKDGVYSSAVSNSARLDLLANTEILSIEGRPDTPEPRRVSPVNLFLASQQALRTSPPPPSMMAGIRDETSCDLTTTARAFSLPSIAFDVDGDADEIFPWM